MNPLEFREAVGDDPAIPDKGDLEEAAERSTHCGKCGGPVRALIEDVQGATITSDLEILVAFRCRDATCTWSERQWRPWRRGSPDEL